MWEDSLRTIARKMIFPMQRVLPSGVVNMNKVTSIAFAGLLLTALCAQTKWEPTRRWLDSPKTIRRPEKGYIPDERTAISVGVAILEGQYEREFIRDIGPFKAKLFGDVWVVYSSFNQIDANATPNLGGPTTVEISKTNGAILGTYVKQQGCQKCLCYKANASIAEVRVCLAFDCLVPFDNGLSAPGCESIRLGVPQAATLRLKSALGETVPLGQTKAS